MYKVYSINNRYPRTMSLRELKEFLPPVEIEFMMNFEYIHPATLFYDKCAHIIFKETLIKEAIVDINTRYPRRYNKDYYKLQQIIISDYRKSKVTRILEKFANLQ